MPGEAKDDMPIMVAGDMERQPVSPDAAADAETPPNLAAPPASREDLLCMQYAVEDWRRDREAFIRRLHAAETGARETIQLLQGQLNQTLAQFDALKKKMRALRARAEAETQAAKQQIDEWQRLHERSNADAERMRVANIELTTALEAAEGRIADLETESAVHLEELQRLQRALAAARTEGEQQRATETTLRGELQAAHEELACRSAQVTAAQARSAALEAQLAAAIAQHTRLAGRVSALETELRERETHIVDLEAAHAQLQEEALQVQTAADAERERARLVAQQREQAVRAEIEKLRQAAAAMAAHQQELETELAQRREEIGCLQREQEDSIRRVRELSAANLRLETDYARLGEERAVGVQTEQALATRARELASERDDLLRRIDELGALARQLERECDRLRAERANPEELRKTKAEVARLERKLEEIESQRAEAAQNHSAAVAGYMVELNQRGEALQARDRELARLNEQLALAKQECADAIAQADEERRLRQALQQQLHDAREPSAQTPARPPAPTQPVSRKPATATPSLAVAGAPTGRQPKPTVHRDPITGPVTMIHLEENKELRECIRQVITNLPEARYLNTLDAGRGPTEGTRLLAVNLLNRVHDPLAAIASIVAADADDRNVFAYCADGSSSFCFGHAIFFPQPVDPDVCVAALLQTSGTIQRLLAVSENLEMTGTLRGLLSRMSCSTSVALDIRQALDLLPMIQPHVLLIDLALPGGDGLRLVSRVRSDPKTRDLSLAVFLPPPAGVALFRQHALRVIRESPVSPAELAEALRTRLGLPPAPSNPEAKLTSVKQAN